MKILTVAAIVLAVGVAGCNSSDSGSPIAPTVAGMDSSGSADHNPGRGRAAEPTIAQIAAGNADFTTLVSALSKANLVDLFNGTEHFTVFAPTNAAFDAAAAAFGFADGGALVAALDVETLTSILTYHVTRGDRNARSVVAAGSLRMLDGNVARITVSGGGPAIENAGIVATDILASNGVVHVIDAVLLPPSLR